MWVVRSQKLESAKRSQEDERGRNEAGCDTTCSIIFQFEKGKGSVDIGRVSVSDLLTKGKAQ